MIQELFKQPKGLASCEKRAASLQLCLDAVVVVVIEIFNEFQLKCSMESKSCR